MSARETIDVIVYDDELVDAFNRINVASGKTRGITETKRKADAITRMVESKGMREFIKNIPTLTRAQRLIATQIPMMREVLQVSFRAKMAAAVDPITLIAILSVYVMQTIKQMREQLKQDRIEYENLLQEGLDLNYKELKGLTDLQTGFATWYDQFLAASETQGFVQAIISIMQDALPAMLTSPSTEALVVEGFLLSGQRRDWWMIPSAEDMIQGDSIPE